MTIKLYFSPLIAKIIYIYNTKVNTGKKLSTARLSDGTEVYCLRVPEAIVLDNHVEGYMGNGIDIKDGDVVFDIGANIGLLGVRACQKYPNAKVFAFEPIPDIYRAASANADRYGKGNYKVIQKGVSDKEGELTFTYFPNSPALSTSDPSQWDVDPTQFEKAVEGNLRNLPGRYKLLRYLPKFLTPFIARQIRKGSVTVNCPLTTVSKVIEEYNIPKIDLLKVDCEGAELAVLKGIDTNHWPMVGKVVAEVHDIDGRLAEVTSLLKSHGFNNIHSEKEKGFEETHLINIFATR